MIAVDTNILVYAHRDDSPFHTTKQRELFALAAMLDRKAIAIPRSSSVPVAFFENKPRASLIEVSSKPGDAIAPSWPFEKIAPKTVPTNLVRDPKDSREQLAAILTLPENQRFAKVIANRFWKRLMPASR